MQHREKSLSGSSVNGKKKHEGHISSRDHVTHINTQIKQSKLSKSKNDESEQISGYECPLPMAVKEPTKIISKTCEVCGKVFARAANVLQHMKLHRGERPFPCSLCGKTFHRSDHLKAHVRIHSKKRHFQCEHCDETFKRKDHLKYHQINFHGVKISLNELRRYSRHAFSQPQKKTILCDVCGISFGNERNLKNHLRIHSNQGKYSCQFCAKSFNQSSNLNIHLRKHTGQTPYKCLNCDKSFTTSAKLKTHARKHTGDLPFTCSLCGRLFGQEHLLKMHMRIHNDHKQFKCSHCDKMFMHSSTLRAHVRTHTKEKPYRCDECGDSFAQISSLTYHRRTHSGEKPYSCDICGKSYTRSATLNVHLTRHTGQKRISCPRCEFKCDTPKNLRKHIDKLHGELKDSGDMLLKQARTRVVGALYAESVINSNNVTHQSLTNSSEADCESVYGSSCPTTQAQEITTQDFSSSGHLDAGAMVYSSSSTLATDRIRDSQILNSIPHSNQTSVETSTSVSNCNSSNIGQAQFYSCYINYSMLSPLQFDLNQMQPAPLGTFFPVHTPDPTLLPDSTVIYIRPNSLQNDHINFSLYPSLVTENISVPTQISFNGAQISSPGQLSTSVPASVQTPFYHQSCHNQANPGNGAPHSQTQFEVASDSVHPQGSSNTLDPLVVPAFLRSDQIICQDHMHSTGDDLRMKDESKDGQENLISNKLKTVRDDVDNEGEPVEKEDQDLCQKFESRDKESKDSEVKLSHLKKLVLPPLIAPPLPTSSKKSVVRLVKCSKAKKSKTKKYNKKSGHVDKISKRTKDDSQSKEQAECKICGQKFSRAGNLTTHMRLHSGERPYACNVCSKTFSRSDHLKTHKLLHGGDKTLLCNHCGETFPTVEQLRGHIEDMHENMNPFACNACTFSCIHLGELKDHIKSHEGKLSFGCQVCCIKFLKAKDLKKHMFSHSGHSPFTCHMCHKKFKESSCLKLHIRTKHTGEKHFKCGVCGDAFVTAAKLQRHIRHHSGIRPYACEFCGKMFIDTCLLKMHVRIHTKEKPFKCKHCEQCFTHPSTLRAHVRIHTGNKPYSCNLCDASFSQVSSLSYHQRKHDRLKPYTCHVCGNSYTRSTTLNIHLTRHTGLKRVSCPHCPFKCDTPKHLRKHVAKLHTGNESAKIVTLESKHDIPLRETQKQHNFEAVEIPLKETQLVHPQPFEELPVKEHQIVLNQVPPSLSMSECLPPIPVPQSLSVPELLPHLPFQQYENRDQMVEGCALTNQMVDSNQQVLRSLILSGSNDFVTRNVMLTSSTLNQL
ncbi:unnamed protein product [Lymnaea stagnalis]|uniref:Zinc finger protein 865 n=1 Tax=Lymnaea stagnalis TaxID=6523 RepID=A0AAV2HHP9_LYMST